MASESKELKGTKVLILTDGYYEIPHEVTRLEYEDGDEDQDFSLYTGKYEAKVIQYLKDKNIILKKGDVVHLGADRGRYRNDGIMIHDGKNLVGPCYDIDDYGSVPPSLVVTEGFEPQYWSKTIDHNNIIWLNIGKYVEQLLNHKNWENMWIQSNRYYNKKMNKDLISNVIDGKTHLAFHIWSFIGLDGKPYKICTRNDKKFVEQAMVAINSNKPIIALAYDEYGCWEDEYKDEYLPTGDNIMYDSYCGYHTKEQLGSP